jgi:hypothetical protein
MRDDIDVFFGKTKTFAKAAYDATHNRELIK